MILFISNSEIKNAKNKVKTINYTASEKLWVGFSQNNNNFSFLFLLILGVKYKQGISFLWDFPNICMKCCLKSFVPNVFFLKRVFL